MEIRGPLKIIQRPWETEIHFCNWRAFNLSVKWKWTMLRTDNMFHRYSQTCNSLGSHHNNKCRSWWPFYCFSLSLILHQNHLPLMDLTQYAIDLETLCTWCHVELCEKNSIHSTLFGWSTVKWTWIVFDFFIDYILLWITSQGPSSSNVK